MFYAVVSQCTLINSVRHVSEAAQAESYPGPSGRLAPKFPLASELRNDEEVIGTS